MLTGEPPRTQGDLNFALFGFPVRVHPFFWLITLVLGAQGNRDMASVLTWIAAVFLAILCHELGHAAVMRAYGFQPWITLHGMGGVTSYDPSRSYGSKGAEPLGQILISLAGPVAGFLLVAILVAGLFVSGYRDHLFFLRQLAWMPHVIELPNARIQELLNDMFMICTLWGLVNLLPIYPLDGGQIAREILQKFGGREGIRQSLILSILAAGMMAIFGVVRLNDWFVAFLFGYLAFMSYQTLQAYTYRQP